jgi:hypothetical protein
MQPGVYEGENTNGVNNNQSLQRKDKLVKDIVVTT